MKLLWALLFLFGFLNQYVTSDVTKDSSPSPSNTNSTASVQAVTTKPLSNVTSWQKTSPTTAAIKNISINVSRATTTATTVSDSTATQTDKGKSITDSHPALETVQTTDGSPATTLIFTSVPKVFTTLQQETASRASPSIISTISQVDRTGSTRQPLTSTLLTTSSVLSWTSVSTTKNHPDITANDNLPHIQPTTAEKEEELECVNLEMNSGAGHKIINCTTEKKRKIILKVTHDVWEKCRIGFQGSPPPPSPSLSPSPSPSPSPTSTPSPNTYLVTILASSIALLIIIIGIISWTVCHRQCKRKNQQHLTEELHTTENGYHDNPTLEVMEVQPEMQEKKMVLNGEFNDSWIVPFDNLIKDDLPDEEDTHL